MASYIVFTCSEGGAMATVALSTRQYPTCNNGKGAFVSIEEHPEFNIATLNVADLGNAFGAGFLIMSTGLLASFGIRIIIKAVKDIF